MTIRKIFSFTGAVLFASALLAAGSVAQAQPVQRDYYRSYYRPPLRYRAPAVIVQPAVVVGGVLPYGYAAYPVSNWGYYNLPTPCCGQYWVPYGQSFLLVSPGGVVLQVYTP